MLFAKVKQKVCFILSLPHPKYWLANQLEAAMRKGCGLIGFLLAGYVLAQDPVEEAAPVTCEQLFNLAKAVMNGRQEGVEMPKLIEIAAGNEVVVAIVRDAFNVPRYSTQEYREEAATDFANEIYATCLEINSQ